ncbi:MAG: aspartate kinase [Oscillospiraceae bacterium]|nr:aspartate kinase [Oscillospiraceae bacterium]
MQIIVTENQSIATFNNVTACYERSFIAEVLTQSAAAGINIDMIAQSPATSDKISFGFTFADDDMTKLLAISKSVVPDTAPLVNCGNVKLTVKSPDMVSGTGFASKVFIALKQVDCVPMLVTTGIDEISLLIHKSCINALDETLREIFDL